MRSLGSTVSDQISRRCRRKFGRIGGAFGLFVAAVRGFCNLNSLPDDAMCYSGWNFLPSEQRNTMRKFFLALTLLSLSMSTGAIAQQQQRSGTPEEQKACTRDVQRYCRLVMDQGDFTILACLQQHRPKLTKACDLVLRTHGQ